MMSRTRKPCPACGEVCQFRPAAEVCGGCKGLLADGRKYRQLSEESGCKPYGVPREAGNLPYIKYASRSRCSNVQNDFKRAIFAILDTIAGPLPSNAPWNNEDLFRGCGTCFGGSCSGTVMLQPDVVEPLRTMYQAVESMVEHVYDEGKARGSNLLMELASGDIALNEFNEATINRE